MPSLACKLRPTLLALIAGSVGLATAAVAQAPIRLRATIITVTDGQITVQTKDRTEWTVRLVEPLAISARVRADPTSIQPGCFIAATSLPGANGTLAGVEVVIFPEALSGAGEGHRPFDFLPDSTMTNATVADEVTAKDNRSFKLAYKGGEQTLVLTPETKVFTLETGSVADLKPGLPVSMSVEKTAAGDLETKRITVDR